MWCLVELCAIQLNSMYNISTIFWTLMTPKYFKCNMNGFVLIWGYGLTTLSIGL
jgi:hypothetical protein